MTKIYLCLSHISHDLDLWLENEDSVPVGILIAKDYQLLYKFLSIIKSIFMLNFVCDSKQVM